MYTYSMCVLYTLLSVSCVRTCVVPQGNPDEHTIEEFAAIILEEVKKVKPTTLSSIESLPLPKDDPHRRKPDISTATRVLGWRPVVSRGQPFAAVTVRRGHLSKWLLCKSGTYLYKDHYVYCIRLLSCVRCLERPRAHYTHYGHTTRWLWSL